VRSSTLLQRQLFMMSQALLLVLRKDGVLNEDTDPNPKELLMAAEEYTGKKLEVPEDEC